MRWLKVLLILIVLAFLGLFLRGLYINNLKVILSNVYSNGDIKELTFKVTYGGFAPLGKAVIVNKGVEELGDKDVYHIKAEAELNWFINRIYKIKAEINSFIDKNKLYPLKFTQMLEIPGKPRQEKIMIYDQLNHIMKRGKEARIILPNTQDPLSILFYFMRQDLKVNDIFDFNFNTNQKNLRFYAKVLGKQEIQISGRKRYEVYMIKGSVKRRSKSLRHSSEFTIWFVDKPFKAPVLMKVFTGVGPVVVRTVGVGYKIQ